LGDFSVWIFVTIFGAMFTGLVTQATPKFLGAVEYADLLEEFCDVLLCWLLLLLLEDEILPVSSFLVLLLLVGFKLHSSEE